MADATPPPEPPAADQPPAPGLEPSQPADHITAPPSPAPGAGAGLADDPLPGDSERHQLPERVVRYWQLQALLVWGPLLLVAIVVAASVSTIPGPIKAAMIAAPLAIGIFDAAVIEPRRRQLWWYAVGEHQLDLQHGWLWHTRTVVPMTRVQHIAMRRGPLADSFTLAELEIYTAAGSVKIPALGRDEAIEIRARIADLARLADDL